MIKTVYREKQKREKMAMKERVTRHRKELAVIEEKRQRKQKIIKKRICRALDKLEKKRNKHKSHK